MDRAAARSGRSFVPKSAALALLASVQFGAASSVAAEQARAAAAVPAVDIAAMLADPSIRDFVGLAENAWDFTAPNGVPGFGPLSSVDQSAQRAGCETVIEGRMIFQPNT